MQQNKQKRPSLYELLSISLAVTFFAIIAPNFISDGAAEDSSIILFFIVPIIFVATTVINAKRSGLKGSHGKAWIFFACLAISQFIADQTWFVYDKILEIDPFPSVADVFYLSFFVFFILFSINYIAPVRKAISRRLIAISVSISLLTLVTVFYLTYSFDVSYFIEEPFESAVALSYTIGDSLVLIPTIMAITLFLRGKVNLMWTLIFFGMICSVVTDYFFLSETIASNYGYGHPLDVGYLWMYVFFMFGAYSNMQTFAKRKNRFLNQEKLK